MRSDVAAKTPGKRTAAGTRLLPVAFVTALALGCTGDSATTPSPPPEPVVTAVSLSASSLSFSSLGETAQLSATVTDQNGSAMTGQPITWTSNSSTIATVSSSGLVTAAGNGTATVTASVAGRSATVSVQVSQVAQSISLSTDSLLFTAIGDTVRLVAEVRDARSNLIADAEVTWVSSDTTAASVSQSGLVTAVGNGPTQITASVADLSSLVAVLVDDGGLWIEAVGEGTALEGDTISILGRGFSADPSGNQVLFADRIAQVVSSTTTELRVVVPVARCLPPRVETVSVQVGESIDQSTADVSPFAGSGNALEVFQFSATYAGSGCFQLPVTGEYLIGVSSASEVPSELTPVSVRVQSGAVVAPPAEGGPPAPSLQSALTRSLTGDLGRRWTAGSPSGPAQAMRSTYELPYDETEPNDTRWLKEAYELVAKLGLPALNRSIASTSASPLTVAAGDTLSIHYGSSCVDFDVIPGLVRYVGVKTIWVEDPDNAIKDWASDADFAQLDAFYTTVSDPVLTNYITAEMDIDENDRTVIFLSDRVLEEGALGFVSGKDFFGRDICPSSNAGEIFYGLVPDSAGRYSPERVKDIYPGLITHEIGHIRQLSMRYFGSTPRKATWELEGGATFMEYLAGHLALGNRSGQNLGIEPTFAGRNFYGDWYIDLSRFLGWSPSGWIAEAPHECAWTGRPSEGNDSPCFNSGRLPYGTPSMLFQLALDLWGLGDETREQEIMRTLASSGSSGIASLTSASALYDDSEWPKELLLAYFYIALWLDDRPIASGSIDVLPTWNVYEVMSQISVSGQALLYEAPVARDANLSFAANIRSASNRYLHWIPGDNARPSSVLVTSTDDPASETPENIFVWVVRLR